MSSVRIGEEIPRPFGSLRNASKYASALSCSRTGALIDSPSSSIDSSNARDPMSSRIPWRTIEPRSSLTSSQLLISSRRMPSTWSIVRRVISRSRSTIRAAAWTRRTSSVPAGNWLRSTRLSTKTAEARPSFNAAKAACSSKVSVRNRKLAELWANETAREASSGVGLPVVARTTSTGSVGALSPMTLMVESSRARLNQRNCSLRRPRPLSVKMPPYNARRIGSWMNTGKHPAAGLTPRCR